jgi:hypothetical protein
MGSQADLLALAAHTTKTTVPAASQVPPVPSLTGTTAMLVLLTFVAVMVLIGKADALARIPLVIVGTVASVAVGLTIRAGRGVIRTAARKFGFRWPQWCFLFGSFLFVGDAQRHGVAPEHAWAAVGLGWAVWAALRLRRSVRQRSADSHHVKAKKRNAAALDANTKELRRGQRKPKALPARKPAAARQPRQPRQATPRRRTPRAANEPTAAPVAVQDPPAPPLPEPYRTPMAGAPGFEPVLPRWMRRRKGSK